MSDTTSDTSSEVSLETMEWLSEQEKEELDNLSAPEIDETLIELAEELVPGAVEELNAIVHQIRTDIDKIRDAKLNFRRAMSACLALRSDPPLPDDFRTLLRLEAIERHQIELMDSMEGQNEYIKEAGQTIDVLVQTSELSYRNEEIAAQLRASGAKDAMKRFSEALGCLNSEKKSLTGLLNDVVEFYRYLARMAGHNAPAASDDD